MQPAVVVRSFDKLFTFDLQSGTFFRNPSYLYDCDFPLVSTTCRHGNNLA